MVSKIKYSFYSGSAHNGIRQRLLDFHVLDNGTVYYRFEDNSTISEYSSTLTIPDFELMWKINISELINKS